MSRNWDGIGDAAKYRFFESYIKPFLKNEEKLTGSRPMIFFDMAERAFFKGIGKEEGRVVRSYLNACERIYKSEEHKKEVEELFAAILAEIEYPATYRVNKVLEEASKDPIRRKLEYYTALVENFVRAFITPIYYYANIYHGKKAKASSAEEYLNVGVIQKIKAIDSINVPMEGIDPKHFSMGLDMRIRHGGTAHEHWEVLDDDHVNIKNIIPETGKVKDEFTLTAKELSDKLEKLERLVWSLRLGFYAFLENSGMKVEGIKPHTKYSVEQYTANFAGNRLLDAETPFEWNDEQEEIVLTLSHTSPFEVHPGGELYLATGVFEIINKIEYTKLRYQVIDVLKYLSLMINSEQYSKYKKLKAKVILDEKEIATVHYLVDDLLKIDKSKTYIPDVYKGDEIPDDINLKLIAELTVPKGYKDVILPDLMKKYPDSDFV